MKKHCLFVLPVLQVAIFIARGSDGTKGWSFCKWVSLAARDQANALAQVDTLTFIVKRFTWGARVPRRGR